MQSPIDINPGTIATEKQSIFINYNFQNNITFNVSKNGEEIVVNFSGDTGYLQYEYRDYKNLAHHKNFTLNRMSFRFPAEHTVAGNRLDGEILFEFNEQGNDQVNKPIN